MASTCLNEQGWHPDLIELQLAHAERNEVRSAYNRALRLAERLEIPGSTLSFHLKELAQAGLVRVRKESRFAYYSPDFERMNKLISFLTENCCSLGTACDAATCAPAKTSVKGKAA